jgi:hypothetical protein
LAIRLLQFVPSSKVRMMIVQPDQPAKVPFAFRECFVMTMPIGKTAANLKEMVQGLKELRESILYYHLWQSRLAAGPPGKEYPNDFAFWAATGLHDPISAEILSSFDPFGFENIGQVREALVETLEDYLWNLSYVPAAAPGFEFHFCEASTVILRSQNEVRTLAEFHSALKEVGLDSVYYHLVDARWRLRPRRMDDFSYWIEDNFGLSELASAVRDIDISLLTLEDIRSGVLSLVGGYVGDFNEPS